MIVPQQTILQGTDHGYDRRHHGNARSHSNLEARFSIAGRSRRVEKTHHSTRNQTSTRYGRAMPPMQRTAFQGHRVNSRSAVFICGSFARHSEMFGLWAFGVSTEASRQDLTNAGAMPASAWQMTVMISISLPSSCIDKSRRGNPDLLSNCKDAIYRPIYAPFVLETELRMAPPARPTPSAQLPDFRPMCMVVNGRLIGAENGDAEK